MEGVLVLEGVIEEVFDRVCVAVGVGLTEGV